VGCAGLPTRQGWITNDDQPELLAHRENGQFILRVMLINTPAMLDKPHKIVFGLQASPTKPMPANWACGYRHSAAWWLKWLLGIYPGFCRQIPRG